MIGSRVGCFTSGTHCTHWIKVSRDSSVGIATRYVLGCPGIESRWGRVFPHPYRSDLEPTQPPVKWVPSYSRGYSGRGVTLSTHLYLALKLKKECHYTSTAPLRLYDKL